MPPSIGSTNQKARAQDQQEAGELGRMVTAETQLRQLNVAPVVARGGLPAEAATEAAPCTKPARAAPGARHAQAALRGRGRPRGVPRQKVRGIAGIGFGGNRGLARLLRAQGH